MSVKLAMIDRPMLEDFHGNGNRLAADCSAALEMLE
jgi:hypothetical protein